MNIAGSVMMLLLKRYKGEGIMNTQVAKQEGLNVVKAAFRHADGCGSCFPQGNGLVEGQMNLDGRLYDVVASVNDNDKLELSISHGSYKQVLVLDRVRSNNSRAPKFRSSRPHEVHDLEWSFAVWLSYTKHERRFLSIRGNVVERVDDSLMDVFEGSYKPRKRSFVDDANGSSDGVRDVDDELEREDLNAVYDEEAHVETW